jgi:hypothetical protein
MIVYFGKFAEKFQQQPNYGQTFFDCSSKALIFTKIGLATFWAIYSQNRLVTLLINKFSRQFQSKM